MSHSHLSSGVQVVSGKGGIEVRRDADTESERTCDVWKTRMSNHVPIAHIRTVYTAVRNSVIRTAVTVHSVLLSYARIAGAVSSDRFDLL